MWMYGVNSGQASTRAMHVVSYSTYMTKWRYIYGRGLNAIVLNLRLYLVRPWGGHEPPPSLHSSPAVGEEPPMLLACLMACQEHTTILTHPPAPTGSPESRGLARRWPAHRSNPTCPPGRQADMCRLGALEARGRQRGRGRGGQGPGPSPSPSLLCPLSC